jgi:hypothetical protein
MTRGLRDHCILLLVGNVASRPDAAEIEDPNRRLDQAVASVARAVLAAHGRLLVPFQPAAAMIAAHAATEYLALLEDEREGASARGGRPSVPHVILIGGATRRPAWVEPLEAIGAVMWSRSSEGWAPLSIAVLGNATPRLRVEEWRRRHPEARVDTFEALFAKRTARRRRDVPFDRGFNAEMAAARGRIRGIRDEEGDTSTARPPPRAVAPFTLIAQKFVEHLVARVNGDGSDGSPLER